MRKQVVLCGMSGLLWWLVSGLVSGFWSVSAQAAEPHVAETISRILQSKRALEQSPTCKRGCVFVSAWDFDGTILQGDASEGLMSNGQTVYAGLAQRAIEAGFSKTYSKQEFSKFWHDYEEMDKTQGHIPAYTYLPKMLKGSSAAEVKRFAGQYYAETLKPYYFAASVEVFAKLRESGIIPYVISAAPHVFVSAAGPTLSIDEQHIFGIEVAVSQEGLLTDQVVQPVPYADGKAKRLAMIVSAEQARSKQPVFVLAAFGNSYHTDSAFLKWTLAQKFPAGRPTAVMINGGTAPKELAGAFIEVSQKETLKK